ncbi:MULTISPECIES: DUF397 domain-containing protein [Streptomyces]|uniref:DUF397 domain-containing protein n=1 Tax=Streptomyces TaxID=1883 RepID=UPI0022499BB9|nr:DUF397 domain-containing protein [Streptomyces sp. JHD 1]MCX2971891.1 DUF397 domain-containing protein [Streptomyces sp. JHD 1]
MNRESLELPAATWRKSSYSGGSGGSCVEVADGFVGVMPVRDSKDTAKPAIVHSTAAWQAFVTGVASGAL